MDSMIGLMNHASNRIQDQQDIAFLRECLR